MLKIQIALTLWLRKLAARFPIVQALISHYNIAFLDIWWTKSGKHNYKNYKVVVSPYLAKRFVNVLTGQSVKRTANVAVTFFIKDKVIYPYIISDVAPDPNNPGLVCIMEHEYSHIMELWSFSLGEIDAELMADNRAASAIGVSTYLHWLRKCMDENPTYANLEVNKLRVEYLESLMA